MATEPAELPADIWLSISCLLSVRDILRLQITCKSLRKILADRYVWFNALQDILTVTTLPDLMNVDLAQLPAPELRRRSILSARTDTEWRIHETIIPRNIQALQVGDAEQYRVAKSHFVPGGEWLVNLLVDGTLCLQGINTTTSAAIDTGFKTVVPDMKIKMTLSQGAKMETLVLLKMWSWDKTTQGPYTTIALYRIEFDEPRFHQIFKVKREHERAYENAAAAQGNLWAWSWSLAGRQFLDIRSISAEEGEVVNQVLLEIGPPVHATLSFLSARQILVTSVAKVSLFDIPPLEPMDADSPRPSIAADPIWTHTMDGDYNYPPVSPVHWLPPNASHERPLAMFTGSALRLFSFNRDFQPEPECAFALRSYPLRRMEFSLACRPTMSDRRVIWCDKGKLWTCVYPLSWGPEHQAGLLRLGCLEHYSSDIRNRVLSSYDQDRLQPEVIDLGVNKPDGKVRSVSWDEASGRLCILVEPRSTSNKSLPMYVLIVHTV